MNGVVFVKMIQFTIRLLWSIRGVEVWFWPFGRSLAIRFWNWATAHWWCASDPGAHSRVPSQNAQTQSLLEICKDAFWTAEIYTNMHTRPLHWTGKFPQIVRLLFAANARWERKQRLDSSAYVVATYVTHFYTCAFLFSCESQFQLVGLNLSVKFINYLVLFFYFVINKCILFLGMTFYPSE